MAGLSLITPWTMSELGTYGLSYFIIHKRPTLLQMRIFERTESTNMLRCTHTSKPMHITASHENFNLIKDSSLLSFPIWSPFHISADEN